MCGNIFVCQPSPEYNFQNALNAIKHRGPDATGVVINDTFWIGFHRLALVGHDASKPPLLETDDYILACNGEIYNYLDLPEVDHNKLRTDTEVIAFYSKDLEKIDGDFAFTLVDKKKNTFTVARSYVGVYPLYYATDNYSNIIAFASEAKALHTLSSDLNLHMFPPGGRIESKLGTLITHNNITFYNKKLYNLEENINLTIICELLEQAVYKRLRHVSIASKVGVLCSGGLDSSLITAMALKIRPDIKVFTIQYAHGRSPDAFYATITVKNIGTEIAKDNDENENENENGNENGQPQHYIYSFTRKDVLEAIPEVVRVCESHDARTIRAAIPGYLLAKKISQEHPDIKVVLSGEGADEVFGGYKYFKLAPSPEHARLECVRLVNQLYSFDLLRADRVFAAFGMELRVPFLDKDFLDYVLSRHVIDPKTVDIEKWTLREAVREKYENCIGKPVLDRIKECFSDGCGGDYVLNLITDIAGPYINTLPQREKAEKEKCLKLFDEIYDLKNQNIILDRIMPDWDTLKDSNTKKNLNGLMM